MDCHLDEFVAGPTVCVCRTQSVIISLVWSSFVAVVMTNCFSVVKLVGEGVGGGGVWAVL